MIHGGRRAVTLLFFGDIGVFTVALWLTLLFRYGKIFDGQNFAGHIGPFTFLFLVWTLVFYISGLYGKRILLNKSSLADALIKTQSFNIILAALFFFFLPGIGIAPKTNLLIYLGISMVLIFLWRLVLYPRVSLPRVRDEALLIATGDEATQLVNEVNGNARYYLHFALVRTPAPYSKAELEELADEIRAKRIHVIVTDMDDSASEAILPELYNLTCYPEPPTFFSFSDVYEDVFDRIPLSQLRPTWFLNNVQSSTPIIYGVTKKCIDIVGGLLMGLITAIATPIIWVAQGFEGPGPLFITQDRIGYQGVHIRTLKFRSMQKNDVGMWTKESTNRITKVGAFLRKTSLDEFPQFWNVLKGELSLVGPRNDIAPLAERLAEALPNYNFRYTVRPGITGWAQINQQYEQGNISPQSIEETKTRLAYDFYYLKHRSLGLDVVIALKTIKRMFFRVSSW